MTSRHTFALAALLALVMPSEVFAQEFPRISQRTYVDGTAKLVVTGAFAINEEVPINKPASISDGEDTWLQFGASGSDKPNVLIKYGATRDVGIIVGKGKLTATGAIEPGQASECSGRAEVTPKLVSGKYTCHGVTAYNPATGKMSTVEIEVTFTAKS